MGLFSAHREKELKTKSCGAVIVAAGRASRMNGIDKVMALLGTEPMVVHATRAFQKNPLIQQIVVVTREDLLPEVARLCCEAGLSKVCSVVAGGVCREVSVLNGLGALGKDIALVAIHDAARPLVSQEVITKAVLKGADTGAAAPAVPVKDTIKVGENGVVVNTPARSSLFAVQTPQVFDLDFIKGAIYQALQEEVVLTDDCMAVERLGMKVHLTQGDEENFKVTTFCDLLLANALLDQREGS